LRCGHTSAGATKEISPCRPPCRSDEKRSTKRIVFDVVFNGALLVSALILTFIVLVREEQFAFGQQQMTTQMMQQRLQQATGEGQIMLPSD
jgi:hypothetical protein